MMAALKLAGMRDAFDEVLADGLKRQHPMQRILGRATEGRNDLPASFGVILQVPDEWCQAVGVPVELVDFDFTADSSVDRPA